MLHQLNYPVLVMELNKEIARRIAEENGPRRQISVFKRLLARIRKDGSNVPPQTSSGKLSQEAKRAEDFENTWVMRG